MSGRLLLVLMMGTVLGSLGQTAQDVTTVRAAVKKIEKQASKVRRSHSREGRRLQSMPDVDFSKLCTSKCWAAIKTSMLKMVDTVEKDCGGTPPTACDKQKDGEQPPDGEQPDGAPPNDEKEGDMCLFDMGKMALGPAGTLAEICAKGVVKELGPDSMFKMSLCELASFGFICEAILGECATDNTQERKLFCPAPDAATDEPEPPPDCDSVQESDGDKMADNFNQMCLYNPTGKFYCLQKAEEWEKKGAFKDEPDVVFPNPCDIDCSKPTGKAIVEMGCCMGTLITGAEKGGIMTKKALRSAKAAVFKCGGMKAMQVCSGADTGMISPTKVFAGTQSVATCPATSAAEMKVKASLAKTLAVTPGSLSLMACVPEGSSCEGGNRRMASSTNTINYAVKVSGSATALAAKEKAVQAKIATVSQEKAVGATTVAAGCGSVSLSLGILILSFLASSAM